MRPRRSRRTLSDRIRSTALPSALAASVIFVAPCTLRAQQGIAEAGALELIMPTGARAVALGQATVAEPSGTESLWWNPALMAWATSREIAIHFNKTIAVDDNAAAFLYPISSIGSVAVSARLFDYGDQDLIPLGSETATGTASARTYIWTAAFAAPIGAHLSAGIAYKVYQLLNSCTAGDCSQTPLYSGSTSAVDAGVDYRFDPRWPLSIGLAVQNIGPAVQFNDSPQRDALPERVSVGASYAPTITSLGPDAALRVDAAVISRLHGSGAPGVRLGAEAAWQKRVMARAGYVLYGPTGSGPSAGLGLSTGRLEIDLARFFSDLATQSGQTPTFISLRFQF